MKTKLQSALKSYSVDEIKLAIQNYSIVLRGKEYYWTYRWTLDEFLARGLTKFLELPLDNFKNQFNQTEVLKLKGV